MPPARVICCSHGQQAGPATQHENEPHHNDIAHRLNWLRAGVLGANDGIVSVAAIVVGVAGVTTDTGPILRRGRRRRGGRRHLDGPRANMSPSAARRTASRP